MGVGRYGVDDVSVDLDAEFGRELRDRTRHLCGLSAFKREVTRSILVCTVCGA